ncbi:MAG: hypothetical protein CMP23_14905 [Rickettsiales bacterium]|nr:hypothetical protein [Rickettsiales bacterium]
MVVFLILGLGLVKLMTSFGTVLSNRLSAESSKQGDVRFYWVHSLLVAMVFIGMVVFWWNAYPLNNPELMGDEDWNLFLYLLFLCSPVTYFMMSDVLMPPSSQLAGADLKKYYFSNYQVLMGLSMLLQLFSLLNLLVFFGDSINSPKCIGRVVLIFLLTPLMFSKSERLHQSIVGLFFMGFLYSMFKYHTHV